jgi:hypothetical protein
MNRYRRFVPILSGSSCHLQSDQSLIQSYRKTIFRGRTYQKRKVERLLCSQLHDDKLKKNTRFFYLLRLLLILSNLVKREKR